MQIAAVRGYAIFIGEHFNICGNAVFVHSLKRPNRSIKRRSVKFIAPYIAVGYARNGFHRIKIRHRAADFGNIVSDILR